MDSANASVDNSPSKTMAACSSTETSYYSTVSHIDTDAPRGSSTNAVISRSDERYTNGQKTLSSVTSAKSSDVVSHSEKVQTVEKTTIEISANSSPKISVTSNSYPEHRGESVSHRSGDVTSTVTTTSEFREERLTSKSERMSVTEQTDSSNTAKLSEADGVRMEEKNGATMTVTELTNDVEESVGRTKAHSDFS